MFVFSANLVLTGRVERCGTEYCFPAFARVRALRRAHIRCAGHVGDKPGQSMEEGFGKD